jgi:NADPH2:quinone reductase
MKAWLLESLEGLSAMRPASDAPDPTPARGEVVLRMRFAALNPADYYLAAAQYPAKPTLPHVLGRDGLGEVVAVGDDAGDWKPADLAIVLRSEIGVTRWGTLAQRVAVPVASLAKPPLGWSDEQAASATLVYLTAWQAITQWPDLPTPATVLINGASGGVGVAATQLAAGQGDRVIALSRSQQKQDVLRSLGASITLDPTDPQWHRTLIQQLGGRAVDLGIDNLGGDHFVRMLDTLAVNGRVSCIGRLAGEVERFNTASLFFRRLQVRGVSVGAYSPQDSQREWASLLRVLDDRRPLVDRVFPFDEVPAAFARLKEGPMGKVVVRID